MIAAHIGDISGDQVFVGYASIVIAMLWVNESTHASSVYELF